MNKFNKACGFTFVELILVVSLLSVLLMFSVPVFRNISIFSDDSASISKLVFLIESLKQKSVSRGENLFLHIDAGSGKVWVTKDSKGEQENETAAENHLLFNDGISLLSVEFNPPRQQETGDYAICFDKNGYCDSALVHLRENNEDVTLRISTFLTKVERFNRYLSYDDCI